MDDEKKTTTTMIEGSLSFYEFHELKQRVLENKNILMCFFSCNHFSFPSIFFRRRREKCGGRGTFR